MRVEVPRANANEDQLQLIELHVADGQAVAAGDLLFILETTKAAIEVVAPAGGTVRLNAGKIGEFVAVGDLLCRIEEATALATESPSAAAAQSAAGVSVTARARRTAAEHGIDLETVAPVAGRIGEAEVLAALSSRKSTASVPRAQRSPAGGMRRAVVIGGGGHAACIIDALEGAGLDIVGCTDDALPNGHPVYRGVRVVGTSEALERLQAEGVEHAFIGVGGAETSIVRRKLFEKAEAMGFFLPPVIHPRAVVAADAVLGAGCQVLAGATIGPRCTVGRNAIVNQGSIVCHDSTVDQHAHLTPGAILAGGVSVGAMSVVGMGAAVLFKVRIGENCLIHNGAQVNTDLEDDTVVDSHGVRRRR